jgi:hypothetical protein
VVCGHIHRAEIAEINGLLYCNDGDWVESCTTLIEDRNGKLAIWRWTELREGLQVASQVASQLADANPVIDEAA